MDECPNCGKFTLYYDPQREANICYSCNFRQPEKYEDYIRRKDVTAKLILNIVVEPKTRDRSKPIDKSKDERFCGVGKLVFEVEPWPGETVDNCGHCGVLSLVKNNLCRVCRDKEWEKGIHGARPDEKLEKCNRCGFTGFVKNGKCRECRGVCSDCGREDVPTEELEEYGSTGPNLCGDCTCCRLY